MRSISRSYWLAVVLGNATVATLARLAVHPVLGERGAFLLAVLATATSAHLAGTWAGIATSALAIPLAAILFLGGPGPDRLPAWGWLNVGLTVILALALSLLGGRFNRLVRQLDQTLRRERAARAEAEHANRLRDEFLAVLSHELRAPLNAIVGWAHVLKEGGAAAEDDHAVDTILRNAEHQVRLISDITDLSRGLSGKLILDEQLVDVGVTLDQATEAVRLSADARDIHLQLLLPEQPLIVRGEADRLRQVFWNLLSNAIKFSAPGGRVQVSAVREAQAAVVRVVDTGQGISAEFLPYVFDSFRQEDASKKRRHGGLGLGLAIVRHLTEAHGGTVSAESQGPATGATVTVTLPLSAGATAATVKAVEMARPQLAGVRLLVVEDDADTRELLVRSLSELGATVLGASSAEEARREISRQAPDVIVSDLGMPDEDGLAFIRSLKKEPQHGRIPAIALTAYASNADREEAIAAGYLEHVPKPVHPHNLARLIVAMLRPPNWTHES
jgi:signal transduction histidine kinase/CheY-like chemotaxis protein